jgi:hypothetical protein
MVRIDIELCDLCAKQEKTTGRMVLYDKQAGGLRTLKSMSLCKSCMLRMAALDSMTDRIKNDLQRKLAEVMIEKNPLKLLK